MVYESFESDLSMKTGNIPLPKKNERCFGGHCILLMGYDDNLRQFKFQNSWGTNVGVKGYFTLPYEYILNPNLSNDFWAITFFK